MYPRRELQTGRPTALFNAVKSGLLQQRVPLGAAAIADMGTVTEQFNALQMRIHQRMVFAQQIDHQNESGGFDHAPHFSERRRNVEPVMRTVAGAHQIEAPGREGQGGG